MCCRGVQSTYNIRVGRSKAITGPFMDKGGKGMEEGGGSLLLGTEGDFIGPGQVGLLADGRGGWLMSMHYYVSTHAIHSHDLFPVVFLRD